MAQTLPRAQNNPELPVSARPDASVPDARSVACPTCGAGPGLDCEDGIVHLGRAARAAMEECRAHHPASRFRNLT